MQVAPCQWKTRDRPHMQNKPGSSRRRENVVQKMSSKQNEISDLDQEVKKTVNVQQVHFDVISKVFRYSSLAAY